jgi:hypothetical protein
MTMPPSQHEHVPTDHAGDPTPPNTPGWNCPSCGRIFRRAGQTHVCGTTTVEDHLRGKPAGVVALFHAFAQYVQAAGPGPVAYAPVKGQVGFRGPQRIFAGVKLTTRGLEGYLDLPRRVESPRFRRISPYTKRLFVHYFVLTDPHQLDAEFSGWIHEAYQVGAGSAVPPSE